ncbi:YncE family protein [Antrihabitans cavernicola]|uniref:YncE family protein n=1 Tax=Antrihabitans cavernicola TaxID=2495913 RepID=A0A5A7SIZ4_9NOCA|nr:hypothetical protein [Spelaeibacter cavernicola]KAA0024405.1 hypothetical protein FOY51_00065 [Spelaeibacter cavernicola]
MTVRKPWQAAVARTALASAAVVTTVALAAGTAAANPTISGSTTGNDLLYLPSWPTGSVQVIDPAKQEVVKTITGVGDHPLVLKEKPDHSKLYASNFGPLVWNITVIDPHTNKVIKKVPTIGPPYAVSQMSYDGRYLFIPTALSVVQVLDTTTDEIVRTLPIVLPPGPVHLELSRDDSVMYVFALGGIVSKYDTHTGALLAPPLFLNGVGPGWGAMSVDGKHVYAVNAVSGVTIIDAEKWVIERTMFEPVGSMPLSATLTPDGNEMWICNFGTNDITVMDAHTGAIQRVIKTDVTPTYLGFSADGKTAYVSSLGDFSNLPFGDVGLIKIPQMYLRADTNGYLDTYDVATRTRTARMETAAGPLGGVYPG